VRTASARAMSFDTTKRRLRVRERWHIVHVWKVRNACCDDRDVYRRRLEEKHGTV
jgi:hypothetical protein